MHAEQILPLCSRSWIILGWELKGSGTGLWRMQVLQTVECRARSACPTPCKWTSCLSSSQALTTPAKLQINGAPSPQEEAMLTAILRHATPKLPMFVPGHSRGVGPAAVFVQLHRARQAPSRRRSAGFVGVVALAGGRRHTLGSVGMAGVALSSGDRARRHSFGPVGFAGAGVSTVGIAGAGLGFVNMAGGPMGTVTASGGAMDSTGIPVTAKCAVGIDRDSVGAASNAIGSGEESGAGGGSPGMTQSPADSSHTTNAIPTARTTHTTQTALAMHATHTTQTTPTTHTTHTTQTTPTQHWAA